MILYRYVCSHCGKDARHAFQSGKAKKTVKCSCGKTAERHYGRGTPQKGDIWTEHWSDAAGVHPDQIAETTTMLYNRTGKRYDFNKEGQIHFESRQHRAAALKAMGLVDLDAGYGDPS